jgi:hypothetical protein
MTKHVRVHVSHSNTIRIAMWSGPRNISTAMMRSFASRSDCAVIDEPFYAAFLALSGLAHPMRQRILASHESDWRAAADELTGPVPGGRRILYQKHMTHHMLPEIGRGWMRHCRHAFLIRHPARVLASYAAKRDAVTFADIGFAEQWELFQIACDLTGEAPPVVDADALLADPRAVLDRLCADLGLDFDERMLSWPPGLRATDGVWARHWYDAVAGSTGFAAAGPAPVLTEPALQAIQAEALPIYDRLAAHALQP